MFIHRIELSPEPLPNTTFTGVSPFRKSLLRGITVAMYIVGQERRLVDPPSQVVAGVRTVTTKMDGHCDAHVAVLILFCKLAQAGRLAFYFFAQELTRQLKSNVKTSEIDFR